MIIFLRISLLKAGAGPGRCQGPTLIKLWPIRLRKWVCQLQYETTVTGIRFNGTDSVTTVQDIKGNQSEIEARFIIDGSGYGRVIPKLFNMERPSNLIPRKAMFAHTVDVNRSMADEPNRITIVVHQPGVWVWIIPFSTGITSLGFVGNPEFFSEFEGN